VNIAADSPVVETAGGRVRGRATAHGHAFHAIPYAAAPTGAQRFAEPRPHASWSGIRDATRPGPTAPQPPRDAFGVLDMSPYFGPGWVRGTDYLTVDVRSPHVHDGPAPVMVFVHGGGFVAGSPQAPMYRGAAFARDGVVLVTVTYRLGIAGFLHLPDAPDNRGLLDVLAALRWVRDNIAAFGGDPDNVTVFGQSAGAILLGGLIADDASAGLLRRAILQSGSGLAAFTPEQAQRVTDAAGVALGIPPTAAALAGVPDERLVGALGALAGLDLATATATDPLGGITPFSIVLDEQPATRIAAGHGADVDLVIGSNADEGSLYLAPSGRLAGTTEEDLRATAALFHRTPEAVVRAYRAERPTASVPELRTAMLSDGLFRHGTRRMAAAHATSTTAATYVYEFAWRSDAIDGQLGACHAVELPFVFDTVDLPELHGPHALLGTAPPPAALAAAMHGAWTRFANTGDPGWPSHRPDAPYVHRFA
jgi:para-nitrobenzyl esterase